MTRSRLTNRLYTTTAMAVSDISHSSVNFLVYPRRFSRTIAGVKTLRMVFYSSPWFASLVLYFGDSCAMQMKQIAKSGQGMPAHWVIHILWTLVRPASIRGAIISACAICRWLPEGEGAGALFCRDDGTLGIGT